MDALPPNALLYLPVLVREVGEFWPEAPIPSFLAAQVEQETCVSLRHKRCWSPYAELKTSREYGFGLGQITITSKFDNFQGARRLHASLGNWEYRDRYNAQFQLRTLVLTQKSNYSRLRPMSMDNLNGVAFTAAAYNGGLGGVISEKKLCSIATNCNPGKWFGNVERHSKKSRVKASEYGQSFFDINRGYVVNVLYVRRTKYISHLGG